MHDRRDARCGTRRRTTGPRCSRCSPTRWAGTATTRSPSSSTWKHEQNPFGASPAWVAVDRRRGRRASARSCGGIRAPRRPARAAVRAVDTATAPAHQGKGIFRTLTTTAVEEMTAEGVDLVFNTPNDNSRPGYLRMGWSTVGRLPLVARVGGIAERAAHAHLAGPGRALAGRDRRPGTDAAALLARPPRRRRCSTRSGRRAVFAPRARREYLRWRYGLPALGYRAIALDDDPGAGSRCSACAAAAKRWRPGSPTCSCPNGAARRERGSCCAPSRRETGADYAVRVGRPEVARPGTSRSRARARSSRGARSPTARRSARLADLDFALGDVELL